MLKATTSQRHSNYYGFVETGVRKKTLSRPSQFNIRVPLGRFLVPFWRLLGFEGGPKLDYFWNKSNNKWEKWGQEAGWTKTWFVDLFLMPKWEAWNGKKEMFALYLLQNMSLLGVVKIEKNVAKRGPRNYQNRSLWRHRVGFLRCLDAFENHVFLKILRSAKSWSNIYKNYILSWQGRFSQAAFGRVGE